MTDKSVQSDLMVMAARKDKLKKFIVAGAVKSYLNCQNR